MYSYVIHVRSNLYFHLSNLALDFISKRIETLYSSEDNEVDIFREIFMKNCRKTKEINDFLLKHDIKKCIK